MRAAMTTAEITYCVDCGYKRRADDVQKKLEEEVEQVDEIELVEGDGGVFEVRIDDDLVYTKKRFGYQLDRVLEKVEAHLGVDGDEADGED